MSRIGRKIIAVPAGVTVNVNGGTVSVKGPLGEMKRVLNAAITAAFDEGQLAVKPVAEGGGSSALWGLERSLVANMVEGVSKGFVRELEIVGVGYKAEMQGTNLKIALGYSHPCIVTPPDGIKIEVPAPQLIVVKGCDKEAVGLVASKIRGLRPPEPYKGKGIRYRNEKIRRKVRKSALASARG